MKKNSFWYVALMFCVGIFLVSCGVSEMNEESEEDSAKETEVESGASEQVYTNPSELKDTYDIIIVGAGGAGMTAAIEAKDAGLNPVILEKMPVAGGNTSKSSSGMNASNTKFQEAEGIEDSNDAFYEETLEGGQGTNDKELLRYFVDHSAAAIDWLDGNGIKLDNLTITGGMSQKRTHRPSDGSAIGGYLVEGLLKNVHERGIPIFVNADVTDINENDGKVNEVTVEINGEEPKTLTGKAIIVTTGGFGASKEMIEEFRPDLSNYVTTNQEGSTGDGITMVENLGGQTIDMDQIQIHPTVQQDKGILIGEVVRGEGAILVNQDGERFVNELNTRDKVSAAISDLPEKSAYLIFDQGVRDRAKAIDFYEQQGYVISGKDIEELAEQIDIPASQLQATVDTWNQSVANKADEEYNRTTAMENDLTKSNYFAIKIAPGIHYTMGGIKINTQTEVLNKENQPIEGLYAAGELVGGLHGNNRIGGNSVAEIIIFGRQAGQQAAEFVKTNSEN
ncbi:flavocytochrome c [Desemzia sp. RIT804]|uniref:flavocytochrome c n=1 Tax=Desemzia sp. RIT 804 TaxID=2810209 RepID=UPI001950B1A2|nr:flavocytochrome c [Desemzia sp. RIT 804]MBM6614982.1 flavocytochrome c [Desemzia sp. RIT 804]